MLPLLSASWHVLTQCRTTDLYFLVCFCHGMEYFSGSKWKVVYLLSVKIKEVFTVGPAYKKLAYSESPL